LTGAGLFRFGRETALLALAALTIGNILKQKLSRFEV